MVNRGLVDGRPKFTAIFCQSTGPWQACADNVRAVMISVQDFTFTLTAKDFRAACKFIGVHMACQLQHQLLRIEQLSEPVSVTYFTFKVHCVQLK